VGEVLEGSWVKGWDVNMDAVQRFTAILDGSGTLEFMGEADVAGVLGSGWINGQLPLPLLDETVVTVAMSVPVDDTGGTASRDIYLEFYLREDKAAATPTNDNNFFSIRIMVDEHGLLLNPRKRVSGTITSLASGHDYTMDTTTGTGDLEAVIFRLVFDGKPGTAGATMSIYLKQSDTLANAEDADEHEIEGSPFDVSDWLFAVSYPAFQIRSENTTIFDAGNEAKVGYVRVDYPDFEAQQVAAEANLNLGMVELWDGDPDSGGIRVYDEDHEFSGDPYLQNGLIRTYIDNTLAGLRLYFWSGAAWTQITTKWLGHLTDDAVYVEHPHVLNIVYVSSEKVVLRVRFKDSATIDEDYYIDAYLTMERGKTYYELNLITAYPPQDIFWQYYITSSRFAYVGDDLIADDDLTINASNSTMTDNFLTLFDDEGALALSSMMSNKEPDSSFYSLHGDLGRIRDIIATDISAAKLYLSVTPFALVARLFKEAEDGSYGAAGTVTDAAASPPAGPNNAVQLNAIGDYRTPAGEYSAYTFTAGTHLPAGRYIAAIRARYVDIETMEMYVWNDDDNVYRNEKNDKVTKTLAATFGYHCVVFDITDADVTGTDAFAVVAEKTTDNADEIRTDYMLIIPIGDGESWPQDLAHNALRDIVNARRVYQR